MKIRLFFAWIAFFFLVIGLIHTGASLFLLGQTTNRTDQLIRKMASADAEALVSIIRDDLLMGNLAQVNLSVSRFGRTGHLLGIEVLQNGEKPIFIPDTEWSKENSYSISKVIGFEHGDGRWGEVLFHYDESIVSILRQGVVTQIVLSTLFTFLLFILAMGALTFLLWLVTTQILRAFQKSINGIEADELKSNPMSPLQIWAPTFRTATQIGVEYRTSRDALEHLKQKEASARAIAQLAHDLRTPLSALRIVLSKSLNGDSRLREIGNNALDRAESILNVELKSWRNKKNTLADDVASSAENDFAVHSLLENVLAEYRIGFPSIQFRISLNDADPSLQGDLNELSRALQSIINNAIEAQDKVGSIEIAKSIIDGFLKIEVLDQGPGFSNEAIKRAFQDGYSNKSSSTATGTGMGLYDARQRLTKFFGTLSIHNRVDGGAAVTIFIPLR